MDRQRGRRAAVATLGAVVALIGTFMPWVRSGSRGRSSYTIFDLADRLGFSPDGIVAWSLRLWPLVPLLLVGVVISAWWPSPGKRSYAVTIALTEVAALWIGGTALAVAFAPDAGLVRVGVGPLVTIGGVVLLAGSLVVRRRESAASAAS